MEGPAAKEEPREAMCIFWGRVGFGLGVFFFFSLVGGFYGRVRGLGFGCLGVFDMWLNNVSFFLIRWWV